MRRFKKHKYKKKKIIAQFAIKNYKSRGEAQRINLFSVHMHALKCIQNNIKNAINKIN